MENSVLLSFDSTAPSFNHLANSDTSNSDSNASSSSSSTSSSSSNSSSSLSSSSSELTSSNTTDASADRSSILQSTQEESSLNMNHDESHSQADSTASLDSPSQDYFLQLRNLSVNVAQMEAEIDRLNHYCEGIVAGHDTLQTLTSTPTILRGNRRRNTMSPVEVIDLSDFEFIPPNRSARNRAPEAVIDLCTPDGPRRRQPNASSNGSFTVPTRRRSLAQRNESCPIVDVDEVTPPKRVHHDAELSQREDSYKCPVCMESVTKREPVSTKCGHVFCRECIQTAISSTHKCPMCNKKLTARQFFRIYL
ncbi:E3 ubiquitin-protein ligase complex slx8-rfp subunit rfp2 [Drosophila ficusphila]|uniref:E3 ubiquitin-protein ligase complex slx8-rfp subunit rfp2 n=1 Tax=Drosophila ficusphila TaxID=30025 RepID=UPI0007E64D80|nr:E3 ubiquitin-protein ligase complex slx8-rfp subunit rfp2 [Drosophila ficusphila]